MLFQRRGVNVMDDNSLRLAMLLAEVAAKNTYNLVSARIGIIKEKKKSEEQQAAYEEIINALLQDKMDLERIAGEYQELYEKVTISDKDIEHLQKTVKRVIEKFSVFSSMGSNRENVDILMNLINKDTLKTMQLIGFNYKEAIGQPLTEVCASAIRKSLGGTVTKKNKSK